MAVCISVIGKDNGPLYFKCKSRSDDIQIQSFQSESVPVGVAELVAQQQGRMGGGEDASSGMSSLQYSFIVSSALDIIEERVQIGAGGTHQAFKANTSLGAGGGSPAAGDGPVIATRELYLGALTAQEEYKVYGYMTNTKIKFVLIVEETSIPLRENDIRMMFRKLHEGFCDLMSNPFYLPGTPINSKRFDAAVNSIMGGQ